MANCTGRSAPVAHDVVNGYRISTILRAEPHYIMDVRSDYETVVFAPSGSVVLIDYYSSEGGARFGHAKHMKDAERDFRRDDDDE